MPTKFDYINSKFTDKAHKKARKELYPNLFGVDQTRLKFIDTSIYHNQDNQPIKYDGLIAVDRIIEVGTNLKAPLKFTISERFRRIKYKDYQDLTLTLWNEATDLKGELFKIEADLFVYGYYNELLDKLDQVIVFNTVNIKFGLVSKMLKYNVYKNNKMQSFITLKFSDLYKANCVTFQK